MVIQKSSDLKGSRIRQLKIMITENLFKKLNKFWDYTHFPEIARRRPSKENPRKFVPFTSRRDYIETLIRTFQFMSPKKAEMWLALFNPDYFE